MYATVNALNESSRNIITVEDPIEYRIAGIKQSQVNTKAGYTFANGLRAALRVDPDVILIGEIRDLETAKISTESRIDRPPGPVDGHANNAALSTTRLVDMGIEPYMVTSALECVVAQRLPRRLCQHCAVAKRPAPRNCSNCQDVAHRKHRRDAGGPKGQRLRPLRPARLRRAVRGAGGPGDGRRVEDSGAGAGTGHRHLGGGPGGWDARLSCRTPSPRSERGDDLEECRRVLL